MQGRTMPELGVLVVDDEPLARRGLKRLLGRHRDLVVIGECGDGRAAVETIRRREPDLVFLDVQMPDLDGFGVLRAVGPAHMPAVVFVTAYDEFAARAFEVHALDYLVKPFSDERFEAALEHVRRELRRSEAVALARRLAGLLAGVSPDPSPDRPGADGCAQPSENQAISRLVIRSGDQRLLVPIETIDWIEATDYYATLHLDGGQHLLRESMSSLESRLDPARFVRIHRSAIVHVDRVVELTGQSSGSCHVVLRDGTRLPVSRSRRAVVRRLLARSR
jgi:two-component system LytT family response regulator